MYYICCITLYYIVLIYNTMLYSLCHNHAAAPATSPTTACAFRTVFHRIVSLRGGPLV